MLKILTIIPARGGSKGIPGKNTKVIGGKSLVRWAIDCAKGIRENQNIVVDTDDLIIANIATEAGVEIHFREPSLGSDEASIIPVMNNVLLHMEHTHQTTYDLIVLLQPTSPFRTTVDYKNIISMFTSNPDIQNVVSVIPLDEIHPAKMYYLKGTELIAINPETEQSRRQDLETAYLRNGCFYAIRRNLFVETQSVMTKHKTPYIMQEYWWANINTPRDLQWADFLFAQWKEAHPNDI